MITVVVLAVATAVVVAIAVLGGRDEVHRAHPRNERAFVAGAAPRAREACSAWRAVRHDQGDQPPDRTTESLGDVVRLSTEATDHDLAYVDMRDDARRLVQAVQGRDVELWKTTAASMDARCRLVAAGKRPLL